MRISKYLYFKNFQ